MLDAFLTRLPRPRGLFLSGGGALGAWQAGALEALLSAGLAFDEIAGFSIGAVNGSAVALGIFGDALRRWRALDGGIMRLSPRLRPFSLFSEEPLHGLLSEIQGEDAARAALRAPLTVISACPELAAAVHARFTPAGGEGWDGPLAAHLRASCAVPGIFPPVDVEFRGRRLRLVDGGVPQRAPLRLEALARCASVLTLELVRAEETELRFWHPLRRYDQMGRLSAWRLMEEGVESLERARPAPRVLRLGPSRRLDSIMLEFSAGSLAPRLSLGAADARAFLEKLL